MTTKSELQRMPLLFCGLMRVRVRRKSPSKGSLALAGQSVERATGLQLEGQPVTVDQTTEGIAAPGTGALTASPSSPVIAGIREPGTATLNIDESTPLAYEPIDSDALAISSDAPTLAFTTDVIGTAALDIDEQLTERWTGLKLQSDAVSLQFGIASPTLTKAVGITGHASQVINQPAGDTTRVPSTAALNIAESVPTFGWSKTVPLGTLSFSGKVPNTDPVAYPARATLGVIGQDIQVPERTGIPGVIIEGPFNYGTFIRNLDATFDEGKYEVCSRSGFKQKVGRVGPDAYNVEAREDSRDKFHPADIPHKTRRELHRGSPRPDDSGKELFIDPDNPVSPDDY
jgi:hypothetical protein